MSEGFGHLASLTDLNLSNCTALGSLPDSKSHFSLLFYFLIFDVRRLQRSQQLGDAQAAISASDISVADAQGGQKMMSR